MTDALISAANTAPHTPIQVIEEEVKQEITVVESRAEEEEQKEALPFEEEKQAVNWDQVYRRYWIGD